MEPIYNLLSPKILKEGDKSYPSIKELEYIISKTNCCNIAVTGAFGSGKSSILKTLESIDKSNKYLNISLATLDKSSKGIEYSIVQQLIYKADEKKIHQSRFRRIKHLDDDTWLRASMMLVGLLIAVLIAFEPSWLRINGAYNLYNEVFGIEWGYWVNIISDLVAICYMLFVSFIFFKHLIGILFNCSLHKLSLKEGTVELSHLTSVFNKHIDEILYFFKATDYNVVVFEDLDRISEPRGLFLKLREINCLLNDSECFKSKNKVVKFVYAIKDDVFNGEERTKFFDYIISAIPIVNSINAGDYLIKEYGVIDGDPNINYKFKITSKQFTELGEYIEGMREMNNIVNEFIQYKNQVGEGLADHILFALTIYKNKYPEDYAKLHNRCGVLYRSIDAKYLFIDIVNHDLDSELETLTKEYIEEKGKIQGIRKVFLEYLKDARQLTGVEIDGKKFDISALIENDELFNMLLNNRIEQAYMHDEETDSDIKQSYSIKFDDIEKEISSDMGYTESIEEYENNIWDLTNRIDKIKHEINTIKRSSLSTIIVKIDKGEDALKIVCDKFRNEFHLNDEAVLDNTANKMCKTILFLLRNDYIDEHFSSYISYFHPGSLVESDNNFFQSLLLGISKGYEYQLKNTSAILKKMRVEYFEKKEILNYDLLDGLVHADVINNLYFEKFIDRVKENVDFILGYDANGKYSKDFFDYLLSKWEGYLNIAFDINNVAHKVDLLVIFYKYCSIPDVFDHYKERLNETYGLIANNISKFELTRIENIASKLQLRFKELVVKDDESLNELYKVILNKNLFEINTCNLSIILGEDFKNKAYTLINKYQNSNVVNYVKNNIEQSFDCFPESSIKESPKAIVELLNNSKLSNDKKTSYIEKQEIIINTLEGVHKEYEHVLFETNHIKPTWDNIIGNYIHSDKILTACLKNFIEINYKILQTVRVEDKDEESPAGHLFTSLFGNNDMPLDIYAALVCQFNICFANANLSFLESDRMDILIHNDKIKYTGIKISEIQSNFSNIIFGEFLIKKLDKFLIDEENDIKINNEVGTYILRSSLTLDQKICFLNKLEPEVDDDDEVIDFANEICFYYAEIGVNNDSNIDLIDVALTKANSWINKIRVINSINVSQGYDREKVVNMLNKLGGEYIKLNEQRKRPRFDYNNENYILIDFLHSNNHISSFTTTDNQIHVINHYS